MTTTPMTLRAPMAALTLALLASTAHAQAPTDGRWRGTGGAALAMTAGNSETTAFNLSTDLAAVTTVDKTAVGGAYAYGRSKVAGTNTTTADKWNVYGQYDRNLSSALFAFGKVSFEADKIVKLNLRSGLAGGLGYKLIDTKTHTFSVFGGAAYTADRYDALQTIGGVAGTRFNRTSAYLGEESSHVLSPTTTFKQRLEVLPGLSGDKANLAKFTSTLAVAMSSTMSLTVSVTNNYNSEPPLGRKKNDTGLFTGINVKLGQ